MTGDPRFIVDHMLGTLARWLRNLGYDTLYPDAMADDDLRRTAIAERRVLLTRDRELAHRTPGAIRVEAEDLEGQLRQVIGALGLTMEDALSRCSLCNTPLEVVDATEARGRVPDGVLERQREFWRCRSCGRFYWRGTHWTRMVERIDGLRRRG